MRFEASLRKQIYEPWKEHYIDYGVLKALIKAAKASSPVGLLEARLNFQRALDDQLKRVLQFYASKERELRDQASSALEKGRCAIDVEYPGTSMQRAAELDDAVAAACDAAEAIGRLLEFVSVNMVAIRKILKKYAKNVEPLPALPGYLAIEVEHPRQEHPTLQQGSFLPANVGKDLEDMQHHPALLQAVDDLRRWLAEARDTRLGLADRLTASQRLPSIGDLMLAALDEDIRAMQNAAAEAEYNSRLVHPVPWVERAAGMFESPPPAAFAVATTAGLVVNNVSTLLFMANYTAVLPPIDILCKRLDVPASFTGAIVGASDAAAIFASVGISMWTQWSFKYPLLFSAAMCFAGNIVFVLSYMFSSLPLLLLCRLLNGLGSARTANRRYTADYVSKERRTMASAAFVACSNLGQALGPLLSVPLALLPGNLIIAGVPVNPVTTVGISMAILWLIFFFAAAIYFVEPPKWTPIGLAMTSAIPPPSWLHKRTRLHRRSLEQPLLTDAPIPEEHSVHDGEQEPQRSLEEQQRRAQGSIAQRLPNATPSPFDQPVFHQTNEQSGPLHASSQPHPVPPRALERSTTAQGWSSGEWRSTLAPTMACVACLFVQKMVQQAYIDGVPLFTYPLFQWTATRTSLFLGCIGVLGVPCNVAVGAISSRVSDRTLVVSSVGLAIVALVLLMRTVQSSAAYFAGGTALFVATVVLEGTATSLMSKVIFTGFARGVFNAGLLSTEAGTFGRFTGNAVLLFTGRYTGVGTFEELQRFAKWLHAILAVTCAFLIAHLFVVLDTLKG